MADDKEVKTAKPKFTDEEIKQAKNTIESHKVSSVFFNSKGEVFTQQCNALNSEKGVKANVREYTAK